MNYSKKIVMDTEKFIELCHFFEKVNYDILKEKISDYLNTCNSTNDIIIFDKIINGEKVLGHKKAKAFYKNNIDVFNILSDMSGFILSHCDLNYKFTENNEFNILNSYIKKNNNNIDKINSILDKLLNLNFKFVIFDENLDFTREEYFIKTDTSYGMKLNYLENMYALVNYKDSKIKYRTNSSNYKIFINTFFPLEDSVFQEQNIYLNNLTFDSELLPSSISKENIYNEILKLKDDQKENCEKLKNYIDLEIAINDLDIQYKKTVRTIDSLKDVESKQELLEVLEDIQENIKILNIISNDYTDEITYNNPYLTKTKIKEELHEYYKKRYKEQVKYERSKSRRNI